MCDCRRMQTKCLGRRFKNFSVYQILTVSTCLFHSVFSFHTPTSSVSPIRSQAWDELKIHWLRAIWLSQSYATPPPPFPLTLLCIKPNGTDCAYVTLYTTFKCAMHPSAIVEGATVIICLLDDVCYSDRLRCISQRCHVMSYRLLIYITHLHNRFNDVVHI